MTCSIGTIGSSRSVYFARSAAVNARRALELSGALATRTFAPEAVRIAHASSHNGER